MTTHELITLSDTTPTRLSPNGVHSGTDITIQNVNSEGYVYVGGSNVATNNYGYRISPNHAISFELSGQDGLWAVSSEDELLAAVIQTGLESNL